MSKIGKLPISIPNGVTINVTGNDVMVKGPKGELTTTLLPTITIKQEGNQLIAERSAEDKQTKAWHGLFRSLVNNMVIGVTEGYAKTLEVIGVGYKAEVQGDSLVMALGYSHPIKMKIPKGLEVKIDKNAITISGIDKQLVGQFSAEIRAWRKPEPYKGKGIKYQGEVIRRKAGKSAKTGGAK